jgi:hypothetical protein
MTRRGGPQVNKQAISFGPGHHINPVSYIIFKGILSLDCTCRLFSYDYDWYIVFKFDCAIKFNQLFYNQLFY